MTKKEKIKKWLKENYKSLLLKIILCIFVLFLIFEQVKSCSNNIERDSTHSSITKRMHIDTEGNYVSDNLLNYENKGPTTNRGITYTIENGVITLNGTATGDDTSEIIIISLASLNFDYQCTMKLFKSGNDNSVVCRMWSVNYTQDSNYFTDSFTMNSVTQVNICLLANAIGKTYNNYTIKPMLLKGSIVPTTFEPYGLTYYSQEYINQHYVSNEENEQQKQTAYNNGLTTNLQKTLIDLLDTSSISGVYAYDSQNNIDYSVNYYDIDNGVRVENLPSKKGLIIQYNRKYNVDTLRFSISSTSFVPNDNWEYNYFKVYCYDSNSQSYVDLNAFVNDSVSSNIYINQTINNRLTFDRFVIGFDYLSSIVNTFESITLHSQVDHIYTSYYDTIYNLGYNDAVSSGESFKNGYSEGFKDGEKAGIYQGQLMQTNFTLGDIMKSVISAPVEVLGTTLDFDIPGTNINIFSVARLVITCLVIAFTIKFLRG